MVDFSDTTEESAFRAEVRAFIREHGDKGRVPYENHYFPPPEMAAWREALVERGWIAPSWPKEVGGADLTVMQQFILNQELAEHGLINVGGLGVGYLGPTLLMHGTDEQKQEYLGPILRGETVWCQGWSEPGAGSDLAALQTRAVREGDEYVLNGQKIWTSGAEVADRIYLLARTDPQAPKHRGITLLTLEMSQPGVSVRPLTTMDGRTAFTEVFFEDVRVPVRNRIGAENMGWYVGMTLTDFERSAIGSNVGARHDLAEALRAALEEPAHLVPGRAAATWRLAFADRWIECEVSRLFAYRIVTIQARGMVPSYEGSVAKLFLSELNQRNARTVLGLRGLRGLLWEERADGGEPDVTRYLRSTSLTVGGGTSEVQRNIISTRGLGLPRG